MKIKTVIIGIILGIIAFFIVRYYQSSQTSGTSLKPTIGILQTASHPALDACREEFIKIINSTSLTSYNYIIKNGEGSIVNLHTAAQELQLNKDITLFYVIATPALQSLASLEKERPIIFAAVTDPSLIIEPTQKNVTGVSDAVDTKIIAHNLVTLFKESKTIGLVYNPSEINSTVLVKEFDTHFKKYDKQTFHIPITSEADITQGISNTISKVDILLAPTDNMVANTAPLIAQLAQEAHKPFVVSDLKLISSGAALALGISYEVCGREAGLLAHKILDNPILLTSSYEKTSMQKGIINVPVFKALKLTLDENLEKTYNFFPDHVTLTK